jgi:hypothetical protein
MEFEESLGNSHHREDRHIVAHPLIICRRRQRAVGGLGQTHLITVRLHRTAEYPAEELTAKVILPPGQR